MDKYQALTYTLNAGELQRLIAERDVNFAAAVQHRDYVLGSASVKITKDETGRLGSGLSLTFVTLNPETV